MGGFYLLISPRRPNLLPIGRAIPEPLALLGGQAAEAVAQCPALLGRHSLETAEIFAYAILFFGRHVAELLVAIPDLVLLFRRQITPLLETMLRRIALLG